MRGYLLAAALVTGSAAQAGGQTGATAGVPLQPGAWGAGGWRTDAATTMPPAAQPAPPASPPAATPPGPAATYAPASYPSPDRAPVYPPLRGDYKPIRVGKTLPDGYADPIYTVVDWPAYGLERPYPGTRWIRYFDDAVLADARGRAVYVRYRVAWNTSRRVGTPAHAASGYTPPVASTRTVRTGPNTTVTTQVIPPPHGYYPGGYGPDYGWGPGVTVTPSIVTTTTTTSYQPAPRGGRR